ncbi:MAG: hypothetical protein ACO1SV_27170 [Fimbriimonas sp.]
MRAFRLSAGLVGVVAAGLLVNLATAQQAAPTTPAKPSTTVPASAYKGLTFSTNVGSFKLLGGGDVPPQGKLTIQFTGTVLVSGLYKDGKVTTSGNVLREIHDTKNGKTVYHGTGSLVLEGKAKAVQFFGRNLKGRFFGQGIFRLYGEFDKNLETGFYEYDGVPGKLDWGTGGRTVEVPGRDQVKPPSKVRINPGGG